VLVVVAVSRRSYWCYCYASCAQVVASVVASVVAASVVAASVVAASVVAASVVAASVVVASVAQVPCLVASREVGPGLAQVGDIHFYHQNQARTCGYTSCDLAKIEKICLIDGFY
jgi:hypothetical protein